MLERYINKCVSVYVSSVWWSCVFRCGACSWSKRRRRTKLWQRLWRPYQPTTTNSGSPWVRAGGRPPSVPSLKMTSMTLCQVRYLECYWSKGVNITTGVKLHQYCSIVYLVLHTVARPRRAHFSDCMLPRVFLVGPCFVYSGKGHTCLPMVSPFSAV